MKPFLIRKAGTEDLAVLMQISRQTFKESFAAQNSPEDMELYLSTNLSEEKLGAEIQEPNSCFYFISLTGKEIGYIKLNTGAAQTEKQAPTAMELERLYVLSGQQGHGAGQLLLDHARAQAVSSGLKTLWLGVWEKNLRAIQFYERNGFVVFGRHDFLLGNDRQTDLLMKLDL